MDELSVPKYIMPIVVVSCQHYDEQHFRTLSYVPLGRIIRKHDISYHMYADDSQLYVDFSPCDEKTALANLQRCIQEVREWLRENFLLLNDKKTEVVIFGKDTT